VADAIAASRTAITAASILESACVAAASGGNNGTAAINLKALNYVAAT
jgi:hypothetical protein